MSGTVVNHPVALRRLEVARVTDLGPRMRRITLTGRELAAFARDGFALDAFRSDAADDHVKVFPPPADGGDPTLPRQDDRKLIWPDDHSVVHRDYTVRRVDLDAGEIDLDFVLHDGGAASRWVAGAEVGDVLHVAGPRASHVPPTTPHVLLVGDETALPAIGRWIEEAPTDTAVTALVEVHDAEDHQQLHRPDGGDLDLRWVHRAEGASLLDALAALPDLPEGTYVFGGGELELVKAIRRHLRDDRDVPPDAQRVTSYWRRGVDQAADHAAGHEVLLLADLLTPHAVRLAATLRLPDLVADGATRVADLAARAGADPAVVGAVVEHLATKEVFTFAPDGTIGLARRGQLLTDGHPEGIRRRLDHASAHSHMDRAWAGLPSTAAGTGPGYEATFGRGFWDHVHSDPALAASFDGYMAEWAYMWVPVVRHAYPWAERRHVLDVGGGMGLLLADVLAAAPGLRGAVVELPATAATARWWFEQKGLTDRAEAVEGSFFDALPRTDTVVLAQVLHDWPDDDARRILVRAREALAGDDGRVVLVERLAAGGDGPTGQAPMVLLMRNLFGATERSEDAYAALAADAGLEVTATKALDLGLHLIELSPAR